jgi:hypothetical protein
MWPWHDFIISLESSWAEAAGSKIICLATAKGFLRGEDGVRSVNDTLQLLILNPSGAKVFSPLRIYWHLQVVRDAAFLSIDYMVFLGITQSNMCLPHSAFNDTSEERGYLHELLNVVRTHSCLHASSADGLNMNWQTNQTNT